MLKVNSQGGETRDSNKLSIERIEVELSHPFIRSKTVKLTFVYGFEVECGQGLQHGGSVWRGHGVHVALGRQSDHLDDALDLVHRGGAGEHGAAVHLRRHVSGVSGIVLIPSRPGWLPRPRCPLHGCTVWSPAGSLSQNKHLPFSQG